MRGARRRWDGSLRNSPVTVFDGLDQSFADELEA
jgi:hypothetical protein